MYKNIRNIRKIKGFRGSIWRTVFYYFFSWGRGGSRRSQVQIRFGKNSKTYTCTLKKTLSYLAELAYLRVFIRKIFIWPRWDPGKIKWDPTLLGWLISHMNTLCFNRTFFKSVTSHRGDPAHLSGRAHLHMKSPLITSSYTSVSWEFVDTEIRLYEIPMCSTALANNTSGLLTE